MDFALVTFAMVRAFIGINCSLEIVGKDFGRVEFGINLWCGDRDFGRRFLGNPECEVDST
jgi:hypothetical protein